MKIATFNTWDSKKITPKRQQQVINEIKAVNADVICLQDVKTEIYSELKCETTLYKYSYYHDGDNENTRMVVFSKYPIIEKKHIKCATIITCEYSDNTILIANVHLPWDSILEKERNIININEEIKKMAADYAFLAGDFNSSGSSSVHHYLTGQRSLNNQEVNPIWEDLAEVYAQKTSTKPEYTLDLVNNPRWKRINLPCSSERFDRIYIKGEFKGSSPTLEKFNLFGKQIDEESGYCASTHYGVVAEVMLE